MFYFGCYGNYVTLAMRYVVDAYCLKESPYQIGTQYDLRQRSYRGFTLVAMRDRKMRVLAQNHIFQTQNRIFWNSRLC